MCNVNLIEIQNFKKIGFLKKKNGVKHKRPIFRRTPSGLNLVKFGYYFPPGTAPV